jgi:hypothetical protein
LLPSCFRIPQSLRRGPIEAGHPAHVLEAVLDQRHLVQVDRVLGAGAHLDAPQGGQVERLPQHADVGLAAGGLQAPGRQLHVLALEGGDQVLDGEALLVELVGVHPDADVPLQRAAGHDLPHPGDDLELLAHAVARVVGEDLGREGTGEGHPHDGLVLGVGLADDRGLDVRGEALLRLGDAGLHVLQGQVHVALQVQLHRDRGLSPGGRWR